MTPLAEPYTLTLQSSLLLAPMISRLLPRGEVVSRIYFSRDITGVAFTGERFLEAVVFPVDTGVYMSTQRQSSVIL